MSLKLVVIVLYIMYISSAKVIKRILTGLIICIVKYKSLGHTAQPSFVGLYYMPSGLVFYNTDIKPVSTSI